MSNLKKILLVGATMLVLTGCSNSDTLTCELKDSETGSTSRVVSKYNDDKIKSLSMESIMDFGIEMSQEDLDSICDTDELVDGMECSATNNGTEVTIAITIDFDKADDSVVSGLSYEDTSYEGLKKDLEAENFVCN